MPEPAPVWEVARLVAELDPEIPARLRSIHPATGWCSCCRTTAPCSMHSLAALAAEHLRRCAEH